MIFTFYSYKGGVGRSMAMANVAEWFYLQGLRVVMIDWDLEAPGLESFFYNASDDAQKEEIESVRSQLGLIDALLAYKRTFPRLPLSFGNGRLRQEAEERGVEKDKRALLEEKLAILRKHLPPISDTFYPIHPLETSADGKRSALWLLPAGWRSGEHFPFYAHAVQSFDWAEFYGAFEGEAYFEWMREQLNSEEVADVVLIDSRTGVTEMGGVCTQHLADIVVSFCVPNVQNMNGVAAMVASFSREDIAIERGRKLETVVVPTRIDNSEKDAKNLFQKRFTDALEKFVPATFKTVNRTFWDLRVPYIPAYAYSEVLAIGNPDADKDLEEAYKALTAHLVMLAPGGSALRRNFTEELQRVFGNLLPSVCLSYVGSDGQAIAKELRKRLEENGVSLWPDLADVHEQPNGWQRFTGTLDQAKSLILVMTPEAMTTESISKEWRYARLQGVCVYPVKKSANGKELDITSLPRWMRGTNIYDIERDWETFILNVSSPCQATRVPFMAPDLPERLVERPDEFNQLKESLLNSEHKAINAVLWGPGGCGKSSLAKSFCHDEDTITHFNDGILWVTLGTEPNVKAELTKLYAALTGESQTFMDEDEASVRLAERLGDKDYLIVIDDVWDAAHLKPFLRGGSRCSRLVTTRNLYVVADADSKPVTIAVGEMTTEQAVRVIADGRQISSSSKPAVEAIAQNLDNWPLLLKLFNGALQKRLSLNENLTDAVNDLKQAFDKRGAVAFDLPNATEPSQAVAKSMSLSLASLTKEEQAYYLQLAFFPEDADISLNEVSKSWGMDEFETKELSQHFGYLSLLKYDAEKKTIKLFGVMRSFIVNQMPELMGLDTKIEAAFGHFSPEEQKIARRVFTRLVRLAETDDGEEDSRQRLKLSEFDTASQAVLKKLSDVRLVTITADEKSNESIAQVADETFIKRWERLRNWVNQDREFLLWRQQLKLRLSEWENTNRDQGALLSGRPLTVARQWLEQREEDLNEAERAYINESLRAEALLAENARKQQRRLRIQRWVVAAIVLMLAGLAYAAWRFQKSAVRDARKDADAAIGAYKKGLDELAVYNNSADKIAVEDKLDKAQKNFEYAIENKPDLVEAYNSLGLVYKTQGKPEEALKQFDEAIKRKPDYTEAYINRGAIFLGQKQYQKAIDDYSMAIKFSPENPLVYNARGIAYQQIGDQSNAGPDFVQATKLKIDYAEPYYYLGIIYAGKEDYERATENLDRALIYGYGEVNNNAYLELAKAYESKYEKSGKKDKQARSRAVDSYTTLFNITKDKDPEMNQLAARRLEEMGLETPTVAQPTIIIFFIAPEDADEHKEIVSELRKEKYTPQVVRGNQPVVSEVMEGEVRYFHPEDRDSANKILGIVQRSLAQTGIQDEFQLNSSIEWGRRRRIRQGIIEVWIPPLPEKQIPSFGLMKR